MAQAEDIIHVDFERADEAKGKVTLSSEDVIILEHIKHGQLDMIYPALNRYKGANMNYLLENLALTNQNEIEKDLTASQAFKREYHNAQIVRLAEQHAKPGFDFDALAAKILECTGKETRFSHVLLAKENAQERWVEESGQTHEVIELKPNADAMRASMK